MKIYFLYYAQIDSEGEFVNRLYNVQYDLESERCPNGLEQF